MKYRCIKSTIGYTQWREYETNGGVVWPPYLLSDWVSININDSFDFYRFFEPVQETKKSVE